jgi:hypothetical protein
MCPEKLYFRAVAWVKLTKGEIGKRLITPFSFGLQKKLIQLTRRIVQTLKDL